MSKFKFWKRSSGTPSVPRILVVQSSLTGDDWVLPAAVVDFVNFATGEAHYRREELPQSALQTYHVDYYIAQVNNGGHGQFLHNSGWPAQAITDIAAGLDAIGHPEAAAIFADLVKFSSSEPARFATAGEKGGFGEKDPFVASLDDRFFGEGGPSRTLHASMTTWLKSLPEIEAVPHEDYASRLRMLKAGNPLLAKREAEAQHAIEKAREADPIHLAMTVVTLAAERPGLEFVKWNAAYYEEDGNGETAWVAGVETTQGKGRIWFHPDFALLWLEEEEQPCVKMDMGPLETFVKGKTGQSLCATVLTKKVIDGRFV